MKMLRGDNLPIDLESPQDVLDACRTIRGAFAAMRKEIGETIVGQQRVVDLVLVAMLAGGHVLLEGPPGLGKTLLVRTLAQVLHLTHARLQCTADLMPADIVGTTVVDEDPATRQRRFRFRPGPVFHQLLLADEINRATPKCQSALLEAMQERSVTVDGTTTELPSPFFVLATQNPIEQEGTYPLPEAQLDRFLFKIDVGHASRSELAEILDRTTGPAESSAGVILDGSFLESARQLLQHAVIVPHVQDFVVRLVLATHPGSQFAPRWLSDEVLVGASPRGAQAIVSAAKIAAVLDGRFAVSFRDIRAVAAEALQHRIIRTFEAETAGTLPADIITQLLDDVDESVEETADG
ncbi:MAG: MoxR family ATPase [Phycisphaerales bacterium]|jgi:MoxR-like ATPase|nr:MoxR family ATPase [Phycisphaerales bacterium]